MIDFNLTSNSEITTRFKFFDIDAPVTSAAFASLLPFKRTFMHARVPRQRMWVDDAPLLNIIPDNASVFAIRGEAIFSPR